MGGKQKLDLSIIIVSFNTKRLLVQCIESIRESTEDIEYETIVVDNASTDGSVEAVENLKTKTWNLNLIKNKKNLGFGQANNQGLKKAKGRYFLLLNSDTKITESVLGEMVKWMDEHPKAGIATCALKNADGSLQGTGGYFPSLFRVFAWMTFLEDVPLLDRVIKPFHPMHPESFFYKGDVFFRKSHQRDWVTGAFLLGKKDLVEEIGFFDTDYFMYVEEVDFCYRAKKAGWQVWYLPSWSIIHYGGASSVAEFPILSEYKGIKTFYKKHKASWQFPVLRLFLKTGAILRIFLFGLLKGPSSAKIYAKAYRIA